MTSRALPVTRSPHTHLAAPLPRWSGRLTLQRVVGWWVPRLVCLVVCAALTSDQATAAEAPTPQKAEPQHKTEVPEGPVTISWTQAEQHVGEEVIVEGRIMATHTSPLSTLLSFKEDFSSLAAVIRPADRDAFPPQPEEYYRGKSVRITGRILETGKKLRMVLTSPRQIQLADVPPATPDDRGAEEAAELSLEVLQRLTRIEESLNTLADRLDLILAALTEPPEPEEPALPRSLPGRIASPPPPPPRPAYESLRSIKRGMTAAQVERLAGDPAYIDGATEGGETWYYGAGRTITFNRRGRVESFVGFHNR